MWLDEMAKLFNNLIHLGMFIVWLLFLVLSQSKRLIINVNHSISSLIYQLRHPKINQKFQKIKTCQLLEKCDETLPNLGSF
jgi:hypothetical protein